MTKRPTLFDRFIGWFKRSSNERDDIARAMHVQAGDDHLVGVGNIHVLVSEASDGWYAQGIEIDYFACGDSLEDVQSRFTKGLVATLEEHLRRFGTIKDVLKWAPDDVRAEISEKVENKRYTYTLINKTRIEQTANPTLLISYIKEDYQKTAA